MATSHLHRSLGISAFAIPCTSRFLTRSTTNSKVVRTRCFHHQALFLPHTAINSFRDAFRSTSSRRLMPYVCTASPSVGKSSNSKSQSTSPSPSPAVEKSGPQSKQREKPEKEAAKDRSTLLLVGLGNPGRNFDDTPHNIGFHLVSSFVSSCKMKFKHMRQVQADVSTVHLHGVTVHVLKPTTFMNISGKSIRLALNYWKLTPDALLVVTDDIALEVGRVRLRAQGSAGGHNGLKSIQAALNGSQDYARLRIGVGAPSGGGQYLKEFVLRKFNRSDLQTLQGVEIDVLNLLDLWARQPDLSKVINQLGTMQSGQRRQYSK